MFILGTHSYEDAEEGMDPNSRKTLAYITERLSTVFAIIRISDEVYKTKKKKNVFQRNFLIIQSGY